MGARDLQAGDDQDIRDALDGPMPHETEMPVQKIEGDPDAGMSALDKLGKLLSDQQPPVMFRAENRERLGDLASGLAGGITADLDQRLPFGIGDAIREDRDAAKKRNPGQVTAGEVVGTAVSPIGVEGKGATFAATVGRQAATGAMQGAAHAIGDATADEDLQTQAWKALAGGAAGGGVGATLGTASAALGAGASTARRFAVGGTAKDYGDIMREQGTREGIDYISKDLGKIPDEQGLANLIVPQSKTGYAKRAAARNADVVGPALDDSLMRAADEVPAGAIDKDAALHELAGHAQDLQQAHRPGWRQVDQAMEQMDAAPFNTPKDVAELKRAYEAESYAKDAVRGSRESRYAQAQKTAADVTRDQLRDVMSQASPETNAQFTKASRDYADTKLVESMAKKGSAYDFAAPLAGAGVGGFTGYESGHDLKSTAEGAVGGALAGRYGADLAANVMRAGEGITGSSAIAKLGGALASKESTASAQDISNESRGQLIPEAIQSALRSNQLGPYSQQFAKAAMSPDANSLGGLYETLSQTDPQFAPYKRMLQQMTAEGDR